MMTLCISQKGFFSITLHESLTEIRTELYRTETDCKKKKKKKLIS